MSNTSAKILTKKQLKDAARCMIIDCEDCSVYCINTIEVTRKVARTALAYRKMLERLKQENNGWQERYYELDAGHSRLFKDFCKLQKENEQLQAQVARMREALTVANNYMPDIDHFCACDKCKK